MKRLWMSWFSYLRLKLGVTLAFFINARGYDWVPFPDVMKFSILRGSLPSLVS